MSSSEPTWFKSSQSGGDGDDCVEVAVTLSPTAWAEFVPYAARD